MMIEVTMKNGILIKTIRSRHQLFALKDASGNVADNMEEVEHFHIELYADHDG